MKFVAPEMEIKAFSVEEILTASTQEPTYTTKENTLPEDDFE